MPRSASQARARVQVLQPRLQKKVMVAMLLLAAPALGVRMAILLGEPCGPLSGCVPADPVLAHHEVPGDGGLAGEPDRLIEGAPPALLH